MNCGLEIMDLRTGIFVKKFAFQKQTFFVLGLFKLNFSLRHLLKFERFSLFFHYSTFFLNTMDLFFTPQKRITLKKKIAL